MERTEAAQGAAVVAAAEELDVTPHELMFAFAQGAREWLKVGEIESAAKAVKIARAAQRVNEA